MGLIKEAYLKEILNRVSLEEISFSRATELLNEKIDNDKINKDQWLSAMDVVRGLECYINQNPNMEAKIKSSLQASKSFVLEKVVASSKEVYNKLNNRL